MFAYLSGNKRIPPNQVVIQLGKRKKWVCAAVLLLTVATIGMSGCGNPQAAPSAQKARVKAQNIVPGPRGQNVPNSNTRASHLEMLARGVHGVNGANCVVFGKYAIVGLDVDPKMDRSRVGTTKYAVAEAFHKDPYGADAVVTADIDMAQRIREIRTDVQHGRPVAGFAEELADMVGRLMPQFPRSVVPRPSPDNPGTANAHSGRK
jgi:YhcN/YlaJ family sporulation lipoprotein